MPTMVDYINRAFFAKDKATRDAIVADAIKDAEAEHGEPDGDEGKQAIVIHNHHNEGGDDGEKTGDKALGGRVAALEDGLKSLDRKISKVLDAVAKHATKDEDGDEDGEKKDDDAPPADEKKSEDEFPPKDDDDAEKKSDDAEGVQGAMVSKGPGSAEPELMEADPALKTGASKMGDAERKSRRMRALVGVVRDCAARAELLAPGIKIAQLDSGGIDNLVAVGSRLCALRREALAKVATTDAGPKVLGRYADADSRKGMSCDAVRMLFVDASDRMRQLNNARGVASPMVNDTVRSYRDAQVAVLKSINQQNHDFWNKRQAVERTN